MSWVRIDDGFSDHPKIAAAGPLCLALQLRSLCYAARHLTDGVVPHAVAHMLSNDLGPDTVRAMMTHGLWHDEPGCYRIHDYLEYNPSKLDVVQLRRKKAQAGRAGGLAFARARATARDEHAGTEEEGPRTPSPSPSRSTTTSKTTTLSGSPPDDASLNGSRLTYARQILAFLNHKAGRNYQFTAVNLDLIRARLTDGATVDQCRAIIGRKTAAWKGDEKMAQFLRPATLFNRTKFAQYLGELPATAFQEDPDAE